MNVQSVQALQNGLDAFTRGMERYRARKDALAAQEREEGFRRDMLKLQIQRDAERAALEEKLKTMELTAGETRSAADRISRESIAREQIAAEREARSAEAAWRAQRADATDNPTGPRGELLGAEIEAAKANAQAAQQRAAAGAPTTLDADLAQTDEWSRQMFRAQQALQQAQATGNAEGVAIAQGRIGRLQRMGEKHGADKPSPRMVKIKVPRIVDGKEAGMMEWEEEFDPAKHTIPPGGTGQTPAGTVPLNSVEALKQRMAAGGR